MKALSFGKPMVLVPIPDHTEQYGNARRAASLHVAELIDQSSLNAETLNAKLNTVLHDEEYVRNSTQIRREISSTNGLVTACDFVVALARHS
jgi:UDP:flavonoid glycosyltransferase YjiC (YdhE family)